MLVQNCYNDGEIILTVNSGIVSSAGGIVGYPGSNLNITNCYNKNNVTGGMEIGGIVGGSSQAIVSNCYNTGAISGKNSSTNNANICIYGIGGKNVSNCYNTGNVINTEMGGGMPSAISTGTLSNCFYLSGTAPKTNANEDDADGKGQSVADLANMKINMNNYFKTLEGWNEGKAGVNDGFPTLKGVEE